MIAELVHLAHVVVRAGVGTVSFVEMFWTVVGLICLKDTACLFVDARQQLHAAAAPSAEGVERMLATIDYRMAAEAVVVQLCFLALGVIAAARPPPPETLTDDEALATVASIALLLTVQGLHLAGSRSRHAHLNHIDRRIRTERMPGGRRKDDPPTLEGGA